MREYCPVYLLDGFLRTGTSINIPQDKKEMFMDGLIDFKDNYKYFNEYLCNNPYATSYHPVQLGLYEGNNTLYTLTSCDYGTSYEKVTDQNLLSIFKIALSVTKAVELYHNSGFLHLDIKPHNILILNNVDLIKLFDYDSLVSLEKIKKREARFVRTPGTCYVPELANNNITNIGISTDIFEIGAMIFSRILGRYPEVEEMDFDSKINIDKSDYVSGISPQAKSEIIKLIKKTVQISPKRRYKTTKELKDELEKIIELLNDKSPYLMNSPKWLPTKNVVGRSDELKAIKKRLDEDGYVFIKSVGGLGKSELTKLFAQAYAEEYHTVQFCGFNDSLKSLVASLKVNGINEQNYNTFNSLVEAKNKVLHLSDKKTLIIVDNFNVTYDRFLKDFLPADNNSFKVIFTTRCNMAADYYDLKTYHLPHLSMDECKQLFHYRLPIYNYVAENEALENLIRFIDYNTLMIVLISSVMKKSGISLSEMLTRLNEQTIDSIETKIFFDYDFSDDDIEFYNKINSHLRIVFSISNLTIRQKEIMKAATLIPANGIDIKTFVKSCKCQSFDENAVLELIDLGWLLEDKPDVVSMHPVVSDLLAINENLVKSESYGNFCIFLEEFCNTDACHIDVAFARLEWAKHLERRFKFEDDFKKTAIMIKVGKMYNNLYQPKKAKKYFKEALTTATNNQTVVELYQLIADIEKELGEKEKAINYYKKSFDKGEADEDCSFEINADSLIGIAECYNENNEKEKAFNGYVDALDYVQKFKLDQRVFEIAIILIDICYDLDWLDKVDHFKKIAENNHIISYDLDKLPYMEDFEKSTENGDYKSALSAYENVLAVQRDEFGENSPQYKNLKRRLWTMYAVNRQKDQAMILLNESLSFTETVFSAESIEMAGELAEASELLIDLLEIEMAEEFALRAVDICETLNNTDAYAYFEASLVLSVVCYMNGRDKESYDYASRLNYSQYSGSEMFSDVVRSVGFVLLQLSKFDEVELMCSYLLKKQRSEFYSKFMANILMSMLCEQKGKLQESEKFALKAKTSLEFIKTKQLRQDWMVHYCRALARIEYRKGNHNKAIEIIDQYLNELPKKDRLIYYVNMLYVERGLNYFCLGQFKNAEKDYKIGESILKVNVLPKGVFLPLYNNIALNYAAVNDFVKAKEYYDKIIDIKPDVLMPQSYFDAIVCANLGWIEIKFNNLQRGFELLNSARTMLEGLAMTDTKDYQAVMLNTALYYFKCKDYEKSLDVYHKILDNYNFNVDLSGQSISLAVNGVLENLIVLNRVEEAIDFADTYVKTYEQCFKSSVLVQARLIMAIGDLLKSYGRKESNRFFLYTEYLLRSTEKTMSSEYAIALNYLGVCELDFNKDLPDSKALFEKSKALFEKLNDTDNDFYLSALKNINFIKN